MRSAGGAGASEGAGREDPEDVGLGDGVGGGVFGEGLVGEGLAVRVGDLDDEGDLGAGVYCGEDPGEVAGVGEAAQSGGIAAVGAPVERGGDAGRSGPGACLTGRV